MGGIQTSTIQNKYVDQSTQSYMEIDQFMTIQIKSDESLKKNIKRTNFINTFMIKHGVIDTTSLVVGVFGYEPQNSKILAMTLQRNELLSPNFNSLDLTKSRVD